MKCKRHKLRTLSQTIYNGMVIGEVKGCVNCDHELRIEDTAFSGQTVASTQASPTPASATPFEPPNAARSRTGGFSAGRAGALLGKTVELEDYGRGRIVDQTERSVGIKLDGEDCRVVYVSMADLIPQNNQ